MKKIFFVLLALLALTSQGIAADNAAADTQKQIRQLKEQRRQNLQEMKTHSEVQRDAIQGQRTAFRTQLAQLKAQKKQALQSGNADAAKGIELQIKQLKTDHKAEAKQLREEYKANRTKYREGRKAKLAEIEALKKDAAAEKE